LPSPKGLRLCMTSKFLIFNAPNFILASQLKVIVLFFLPKSFFSILLSHLEKFLALILNPAALLCPPKDSNKSWLFLKNLVISNPSIDLADPLYRSLSIFVTTILGLANLSDNFPANNPIIPGCILSISTIIFSFS